MDEKNISQTPFLTLDPDLGQSAEAAPQTPETSGRAAAKTTDDLLSSMSDEEQQMVRDFSEKIDLSNSNMVLRYGADAQKKLANFSGKRPWQRAHQGPGRGRGHDNRPYRRA